jgi:hypothetical protein
MPKKKVSVSKRVEKDNIPLEKKFGYEKIDLLKREKQRLISEGWADDTRLFFKLERIWEEHASAKPRYAETSKKFIENAKKSENQYILLSKEEIEFLREKLFGVNDPIGVGLLEKISALTINPNQTKIDL